MLSRKSRFALFLVIAIQGLYLVYVLLRIPSEGGIPPFGLTLRRMILAALFLAFQLALLAQALGALFKWAWADRLYQKLDSFMGSARLLLVLCANLVFASGFLLILNQFETDRQIVGVLERMAPVLIYIILACVELLIVVFISSHSLDRFGWLWSLGFSLGLIFLQICLVPALFSISYLPALSLLFNVSWFAFWNLIATARKQNLAELMKRTPVLFAGALFVGILLLSANRKVAPDLLTLCPAMLVAGVSVYYVYFPLRHKLNRQRKVKNTLIAILIVALGVVYLANGLSHGASQNTDLRRSDQRQFLLAAQLVKESGFRYLGNRNQMPLFPYILALFYRTDLSMPQFFELAKTISVWVSVLCIGGIFLVSRSVLPPDQSLLFTMIMAFSIFIFRAAYVKVELLYFFLSFAAFVVASWLLVKPSYRRSILGGVVFALAYLGKASILPMIVVYVATAVVSGLIQVWRYYKSKATISSTAMRSTLISPALVLVVFLLLISPYIRENKAVYGQYFYNENTSFIMWFDSFDQAKAEIAKLGPPENWAGIPSNQFPGPANYLQNHSVNAIFGRISSGLDTQIFYLANPANTFNYLFGMLFLSLVFLLQGVRNGFRLDRKYFSLTAFVVVYFMTNLFLVSFYSAISGSSRFIQSMFAPIMFSCFVLVNSIRGELKRKAVPRLRLATINLILWLFLFLDIYITTSHLLKTGYFGA